MRPFVTYMHSVIKQVVWKLNFSCMHTPPRPSEINCGIGLDFLYIISMSLYHKWDVKNGLNLLS